jgi:hypothetical protein
MNPRNGDHGGTQGLTATYYIVTQAACLSHLVIFATCLNAVIIWGFSFFQTDSIGRDIPKMLELFKTGHEIMVDEERENFLSTKIATVSTLEMINLFFFCSNYSLIL